MNHFGANVARPSDKRRLATGGILAAALAMLAACGGSGSTAGAGGSGASGSTGGPGSTSSAGSNSSTGAGMDHDAGAGGSTPGGQVAVIAGAVGTAGDVDGPQGMSRLLDVGGMAYLDPTLYVADRHHHLRKIDVSTGVTSTAVDDNGKAADFFQPIALAPASANSLFVLQGLQTMNDGIVGQLSRYNVASGVIEPELTPDANHNVPYDIVEPVPLAAEKSGNVIIGDAMRWDAMTYMLSDIGIRMVWGTSATLTAWAPVDSATYSVHRAPSMVLKSDLGAKTWELVAGEDQPSAQPAIDGPKGMSRFSNKVGGAAYDGAGHLFVADTNANAIRKVDVATGSITTVIGELSPSGSIVVGDLKSARLHHPIWLSWLGGGKLAIGCPEDFVVLIASGL